MTRQIVLASSSPYRRELLSRLNIPFDVQSPDIEETPLNDENPAEMVQRLSVAKADALRQSFPDALIIGSDQCVVLKGKIIGKPGSYEVAYKQLQAASGSHEKVLTGLCLLDAKTGIKWQDVVDYDIIFRQLDSDEINRYLQFEKPYDCAGSLKAESLGMTLLKRMRGNDPTALIGLPLIRLSEMLRAAGLKLPP